ncbi:dihydrofolate reductase [Streptohalobacillus salinus]|uniref:Dihydrofolate reductase n=1 Tax=Streptohalobacillus salinus TaxID=621096 RepID=A0A2V3WE43_9BACI|nr:dihydrofolate reductase [Streptohalobacillus salinus]PXW91766.1 dihydrofolate reductase [Streptohalobacillus salinus]
MIAMIAAHGKDFVIGKDNWMPWSLPLDLQFFKEMTLNKTIVMGRKTFESFNGPLPKRDHIIVTRNQDYQAEGCRVEHDVDRLIEELKRRDDEVMIIGGGEIYQRFLPAADRLYITYIDHAFNGDTYFPDYRHASFTETAREKGLKNAANPYDYYFIQYDRNEETN